MDTIAHHIYVEIATVSFPPVSSVISVSACIVAYNAQLNNGMALTQQHPKNDLDLVNLETLMFTVIIHRRDLRDCYC